MLRVNPVERPQDPVALAAYLQTCLTRVERRENTRRQLSLPIAAMARFVRPDNERAFPPKPLAIAAFVVGFVMAAALVFSGMWRQRQLGSLDQHPRLSAPAAAEQSVPAVSPPPLFARQDVGGSSGDEPHTIAKRSASPEVAPPAEGPSQTSIAGIVESEQTPIAATEKKVAKSVDRSADDGTMAAASPAKNKPQSASTTRTAKTRGSTGKRVVSHARSHSRPRGSTDHMLARNARRAKAIPKLHVGSKPAELVGTTSDGRWILSVSDSGRRLIVPPPPGYGP
jgi:cytoskeletal protein RodZ